MKKFLLFTGLFFLLSIAHSIAQDEYAKYAEESANLRNGIWSWEKPEFAERTIPEEYKNASKVIIARHLQVTADSKKKLGVAYGGFSSYRELMLLEIIREAIKLNDKSSVTEYSELSYTQLEKRSGFIRSRTTLVYVGIKVIKPDGTVKEINADDIVLTKEAKHQREAKIAVPDLQPGDIIDYYIAKRTNMSHIQALDPYILPFYDDVPIMHCSMHIETGKKYAIEYRSYNGAPEFKVSKGEDDDNVLDVSKKNIPAMAGSNLWTSAFRQLPLVRVNIIMGYKGLAAKKMNARKPGEVFKNQDTEEYLDDKISRIALNRVGTRLTFGLGPVTGEYMKSLKKIKNKISSDSLARELFYIFRFNSFLEQSGQKEISRVLSLPSLVVDEDLATQYLGEFMKHHGVDNLMVYASGNRGPRLNEIMSSADLNNIIMVRNVDHPYYGFSTIFTVPGYIPQYFENTKNAITVDTKHQTETNYKKFNRSTTNIAGTPAAANARIEKMELSISSQDNMLDVKRRSVVRGHYKSIGQQNLVLFEDYYNAERKYFNDDKDLIERLSEGRKTKKFAEELEAAFEEARKNNKEAFLSEAKSFFELDVTDIADYKVENIGARHTNPDFIYSSQFKLSGIIKKAGSSYIIDIGKLQGSQLKIENEQRNRSLDIYAPFARSLQYQISLKIPEGYAVEGLDALNKKIENATGAFISEAVVEGSSVNLNITKIYRNAYEPSTNWNQLLAFIDAAADFSNAKIVFKKK